MQKVRKMEKKWPIFLTVFVALMGLYGRALLQRTPNEHSILLFRMRHMNASRLHVRHSSKIRKMDVLLLVFGMKSGLDDYVTSISTLENYRPAFGAMVYLSPLVTCKHNAFNTVPCIDCVTRGRRPDTRIGYKCLVDVALIFEEIFTSNLKGFLFIHADFWLTPTFIELGNSLLEHYPGAHWLPGHSSTYALKCSNLPANSVPTVGWWWDNSACGGQERCRVNLNGNWPPQSAAVQRAQALHAGSSSRAGLQLKYNPDLGMWADMYFVPKESYAEFGLAEKYLKEAKVMNEIAVPMAMLTSCDVSNGSIVKVGCWGSCCTSLEDPSVLHRESCGHRLQLNDASQVAALEKQWAHITG